MIFLISWMLSRWHPARSNEAGAQGCSCLAAGLVVCVWSVVASPVYAWLALRQTFAGGELLLPCIILYAWIWVIWLVVLLVTGVGWAVLFAGSVGVTAWGVYERARM